MYLSSDFFKIYFLRKKIFCEYHRQSVNQIVSRSGLTFVGHFFGPDLGPNCFQMLSAEDTSR